MSKIVEEVSKIIRPLVKAKNLELVDIDYLKEGSDWVLRVYIDNPEGDLKLEHCEDISRMLSSELDARNLIKKSYVLEVSSPGLERPLKSPADFERFTGEQIKITTYAPIADSKEFTGKLLNYEKDSEFIELKDKKKGVIQIPFSKIANSHLTVDF